MSGSDHAHMSRSLNDNGFYILEAQENVRRETAKQYNLSFLVIT